MMASALLGCVAVLLWHAASAIKLDRQGKDPAVVTPEIVVPGEWMTNPGKNYLFLPFTVPSDFAGNQLKVMANGAQLLVLVTQQPKEEPDTQALRKYKLLVEAIKNEAGHDEKLLQSKLATWLETEDDDEVKQHIRAALDSLMKVQVAKTPDEDKSHTVSVRLGDHVSLLDMSVPQVTEPTASVHALSAVLRGTTQHIHHSHRAKIIKESFAVEIPYPVDTESIALISTNPGNVMVVMPLVTKSMEANGISTGTEPFKRVPVFSNVGKWVAGPRAELRQIAPGLDVQSVISQAGFQPLSDD